MKAHKLEVIIDFDEIGADSIKEVIENARYGQTICSSCKYEYRQHPMHADGVVNVLCDGKMVKL